MIKRLVSVGLSVVFFVCFVATTWAGGLTVGNGGGFAESNLNYAFSSFTQVLRRAALHPLFNQSQTKKQLADMIGVAPFESNHPENLKIVKEHPEAGHSWGDAAFVGSSNMLSPWYVSLDALYPTDLEGNVQPFTYAQSLGLVLEMMALRFPEYPAASWKEIATKLSKVAQLKSEFLYFATLGMVSYEIPTVSSVNDPVDFSSWGILITDSEKVHDVLPALTAQVKVMRPDVEAVRFSNLYWTRINDVWSVRGVLSLKNATGRWENEPKTLSIRLPLKKSQTEPRVNVLDSEHVEFFIE